MKSVIVFYVPAPFGETPAVRDIRKEMRNNLEELKNSELSSNFEIIIVEDPAREKVETDVFFKPE